MRGFIIIILFLGAISTLNAQSPLQRDSSFVQQRMFDTAALSAYRAQPAFQYEREMKPVLSWWDRLWLWFWDKIDKILSTPAGKNTFIVLLVVLSVAAIAFIVFKLTGDRSRLFGGSGKSILPYTVGEEDIHSISFEDAIRDALQQENYRLAVRLLYLQSLKMLSDRQLIDWRPGKTNTAYVNELKGHASWESFAHLTTEFEITWYGGEAVSHAHYLEIAAAFDQFKSSIQR